MPTLLSAILLIQVLSTTLSIDLNDLRVEIGDEDDFGSQGELWRSCDEVPCIQNFVCIMRKLTCLSDECSNISPLPLCVPGDPQNNCSLVSCVDGFKCIHVEEKCESSGCLPKPKCIADESLTDNVDKDFISTASPPAEPSDPENEPFADSPIMHLHIPMPSATGPSTRPPPSSLPPRTQISQIRERKNQRQPRTSKPGITAKTTEAPIVEPPKPPSPPKKVKQTPARKNFSPVPSGTHRTITLDNLTVIKDLIVSNTPKVHEKIGTIQHEQRNVRNSSTPAIPTTSENVLRSHVKPPKRHSVPIKPPTRRQTEKKLQHHFREPHKKLRDSNRFSIEHLHRSISSLRASNPQYHPHPVAVRKRENTKVVSRPQRREPIKTKPHPIHPNVITKKPQNSRAVSFIFLDADPQLVSAIGDFAHRNRNTQRRGVSLSRQIYKHDPCNSIKCSANQRCEPISETAAMCAQIPLSRNTQLQQINSPWALQPPSPSSKSLNDFVQGTVKTVQDYITQLECIFSGKCSKGSQTATAAPTTTSRPKNPSTVRDYIYFTRHPCDSVYCINGFCRVTDGRAHCVPDYMTNPVNQPTIITTPRTTLFTTIQRPTTTTSSPPIPLCGNFEELKPCGKNCETTCTDGKQDCVPQCGLHECVCMEGFHRYAGFCVRPAICPVNPFAGGK